VDVPIWQKRATRVARSLFAGGPDMPAKADGPPPKSCLKNLQRCIAITALMDHDNLVDDEDDEMEHFARTPSSRLLPPCNLLQLTDDIDDIREQMLAARAALTLRYHSIFRTASLAIHFTPPENDGGKS